MIVLEAFVVLVCLTLLHGIAAAPAKHSVADAFQVGLCGLIAVVISALVEARRPPKRRR